MHFSRQHAVVVLNERKVAPVEQPEVGEAVGERRPLSELLLEGGEAGRHRVAARIDDLRVRQNKLDEAYELEVVRHLVDEKGASELSQRVGLVEVALAERLGLLGADLPGALRISVHVPGGEADDGQLERGLDRRVTGENLLNQGRPGPRQADDEYRVRRGGAEPRTLGEESLIEDGDGSLNERGERVRIVARLGPHRRCALGIRRKGAAEIAYV